MKKKLTAEEKIKDAERRLMNSYRSDPKKLGSFRGMLKMMKELI